MSSGMTCKFSESPVAREDGPDRMAGLSHSTRGSCTNVSRMLSIVSLWARNTCRVIPHTLRKMPSIPVGPRESIMFCVRRNGTISGFSSVSPLSNRQLKSTWTQSPDIRSIRRFSPCLSPRPRICPTIDHTAVVRENLNRASNQLAGVENCFRNHLCIMGGNISTTSLYHARQFLPGAFSNRSYNAFAAWSAAFGFFPGTAYAAWQQCRKPMVKFTLHTHTHPHI
mmetsp:Transcript_42631/g.76423  ORF Transcript_42631/g.76423 Transcript_42631/m.76423 type:complete len:225 (-) Transcript_42631:2912-3586(-)